MASRPRTSRRHFGGGRVKYRQLVEAFDAKIKEILPGPGRVFGRYETQPDEPTFPKARHSVSATLGVGDVEGAETWRGIWTVTGFCQDQEQEFALIELLETLDEVPSDHGTISLLRPNMVPGIAMSSIYANTGEIQVIFQFEGE